MRILAFSAIVAAGVSAAAAPAHAATIVNENFESGFGVFTPTGAGTVGIATGNIYNGCCGTSGSSANMANHFVAFGGGDQPSGLISSPISLVTGTSYTLDFDFRALGPTPSETLYAVINGATYDFAAISNANLDLPYQHATITFVAVGPSTTLRFYSSGLASVDAILDNVVLSGAAVPEPSTWAMMLLGFGAIGLSVRKRSAGLGQLA